MEFLTEKSKKRSLTPEEETAKTEILSFKDKFCAAMDDDLNTADAIAALFDLVKYLNSANKEAWPKELYDVSIGLMRELGGVLGIFHRQQEDTIPERAKELIEQRKEARTQKDWAKADEIRDELLSLGIEVADTRQGMKIRILEK